MEKTPAPKESELLRQVYSYIMRHENFPDNSWLARQLDRNETQICNLKKKLKEKGYLWKEEGIVSLTEKAYRYLERLQSKDGNITPPLEIPIWGEVKAGKTKRDELAVYLHDLATTDIDVPTIAIPQTKKTGSTIFVLRVVGQSMEHEGIFDGNYVIVERFQDGTNEGPKENEMIVTRYLPSSAEEYAKQQGVDWSDEWLEGPTIKFYGQREENGELIHRLSWRKDINSSPYTIKTRYIKPVGRVIGVYRAIL